MRGPFKGSISDKYELWNCMLYEGLGLRVSKSGVHLGHPIL